MDKRDVSCPGLIDIKRENPVCLTCHSECRFRMHGYCLNMAAIRAAIHQLDVAEMRRAITSSTLKETH
jgi:hypothetical protein